MINEIKSGMIHFKAYASDNIFRNICYELMYKVTGNYYWLRKMGFAKKDDSETEEGE